MIIEALVQWSLSVITNAIDLLPDNGTLFNSVKGVSFNIFGFMTLMDGYIPIKEFLIVAGLVMVISLTMQTIRVSFGVATTVWKLLR